jgi:hypothetical protein
LATKFVAVNEDGRRIGALGEAMAGVPPEVAQARPAVHSRWLSAAVALLCALAGLAAMAGQPHAQAVPPTWPSKPVRIVVPWPPGGSADLIGRMLAEHLSNAFAQSVLVENRPGASGILPRGPTIHWSLERAMNVRAVRCVEDLFVVGH